MASHAHASILATRLHALSSRLVNQEYQSSVALPASDPAQPNARYPTVYLLDANWYFGLVTDITRIMARCETFPETLVVGIGYPLDEPLDDAFKQIWANRSRDLTPTVDHEEEREEQEYVQRPITAGGAPHFLQFIREELIPFIDNEYRTDGQQRTLVGHSSSPGQSDTWLALSSLGFSHGAGRVPHPRSRTRTSAPTTHPNTLSRLNTRSIQNDFFRF